MLVLVLQWASYATNGIQLWWVWWRESGQGSFRWSTFFEQGPMNTGGVSSRTQLNKSGLVLDSDQSLSAVSSRIYLDCLLTSLFTVTMLLGSARRLNRMDRLSYVNQHVLQAMVNKQQGQISGKQVHHNEDVLLNR